MGRVLLGLVLLCVTLPCYVWYVNEQAQRGGGPWQQARAYYPPPTPSPARPAHAPEPYRLLNDSAPPPMEELAGLAEDDDDVLMDLRGFRWLLGGEPATPATPSASTPTTSTCAPLVLVLVHTATDHIEHRRLIRTTWGSRQVAPRGDMMVRFLVGLTADADTQRRLSEESAQYGDMVQGTFVDAYRNMTYKHAMALKWFATRCPRATYLLKVDDDVMVNTPVLLDFLRRGLSPHGARRLLACTVVTGALPKRTWRSKWRVSYREYAAGEYPTYCEGWAVLYSPDVALALYRELQRERYFWIDDVLVTGVLAERLGLTHALWDSLVLSSAELPRLLAGEKRPEFMLALWFRVKMDMQVERELWRRVVADERNATHTYQ